MKAELITRFKDVTPEGDVIELVVWRVPQPVPLSTMASSTARRTR
jgi:hypothetical protein